MLKRSKRKLPCVKRTKKEPVLETIYEEQKLLVDIDDEDDSHEVIVRLMLMKSDLEMFDYLISDIDKQDIVTFREPKRSRSGLWELFQF